MKGLQTHVVTKGDSLQKLARMYGVDKWWKIAEINDLDPPYLDSEFPPVRTYEGNVAKVGDLILIPTFNTNALYKDVKNEEIENLAYGSDLKIYTKNELRENRIKGHTRQGLKDIELAKGLENLAQQLSSRLSVNKGALLMHPDYGSDLYKYVGTKDTQETRNKIAFEVESCLRSDFRVKEVLDISLKEEGEGLIVNARIVPIEPGQPFDFIYLIEEG